MTEAEIEAQARELYAAFRETEPRETLPWDQITDRAKGRYRDKALAKLTEDGLKRGGSLPIVKAKDGSVDVEASNKATDEWIMGHNSLLSARQMKGFDGSLEAPKELTGQALEGFLTAAKLYKVEVR